MIDVIPSAGSPPGLVDFSVVAPNYATTGYPEEFLELHADPARRLLSSSGGRVIAYRNEDLRKLAANPLAGNMPYENLMRRAFIENSQDSRVGVDSRPSSKRFFIDQIFTANPPRHTAMRHILAKPLMPNGIERLKAEFEQAGEDLVDELAGAGEVDFATAYSDRLAGRYWELAFGMRAKELDRVICAVRAMNPLFLISRTPEEIASLEISIKEYMDAVSEAVDRSIHAGSSELLQSMKNEFDLLRIEARPEKFGDWVATNVIDGFHTVAIACTNVLYCLLRVPEALSAAQADASLLPGVLSEGLRMLAPVMVSNRFALKDFEYEGVKIAEGTAIAMIWAAGNRDPTVFEAPNVYSPRRSPRTPMTFGGGVHVCPGRYAGSHVISVALKSLINPRIDIALSGGRPRWLPRTFMRQADRMPVTIRRRS